MTNVSASLALLLVTNSVIWLNSYFYTGSDWQVKSGRRFDLFFTCILIIFQSGLGIIVNFGPTSLGRFSIYLVGMVSLHFAWITLLGLQLCVSLWRWGSSCTGNEEMEQVYANHKLVYYCYLIVGIIVVGLSRDIPHYTHKTDV